MDKKKKEDPRKDVLVLGGAAAGKTLLVRRLKNLVDKIETGTSSTVGVDLSDIEFQKKKFQFQEVGFPMCGGWFKYYERCRLVIYVVDVSNFNEFAGCLVEFYNVLGDPKLKDIPVMLVFNKIDSQLAMDFNTIESFFRLRELHNSVSRLSSCECSALTGEGCIELLEWVASNCNKKEKTCKCF